MKHLLPPDQFSAMHFKCPNDHSLDDYILDQMRVLKIPGQENL